MTKTIILHSIINFLYGFCAGLPIAAMFLASQGYNSVIIFIAAFFYYQFLSEILNRKNYSTFLGKRVIFGIPTPLGFWCSFEFSELIKTII